MTNVKVLQGVRDKRLSTILDPGNFKIYLTQIILKFTTLSVKIEYAWETLSFDGQVLTLFGPTSSQNASRGTELSR